MFDVSSLIKNPLTSSWVHNYFTFAPFITYGAGALFRASILPAISAGRLHGRVVELAPALKDEIDPNAGVYSGLDLAGCASNNGPHGVIFMPGKLKETDQAAWEAVLLHEAGHMYYGDSVKGPAFIAVVSGVAAISVMYLRQNMELGAKTFALSFFLPSTVACLTEYGIQFIQEPRADAFSIKRMTGAQLQGAERVFTAIIAIQRNLAQHYPLTFDSNGDRYLDPHGSTSARLKLVREAMQRQNVSSDSTKLAALVNYFYGELLKNCENTLSQELRDQILAKAQVAAQAIIEKRPLPDRTLESCQTTHGASNMIDRLSNHIPKVHPVIVGGLEGAKLTAGAMIFHVAQFQLLERASRALGFAPRWPLAIGEYETIFHLPTPRVATPLETTAVLGGLLLAGAGVGALLAYNQPRKDTLSPA